MFYPPLILRVLNMRESILPRLLKSLLRTLGVEGRTSHFWLPGDGDKICSYSSLHLSLHIV